MVSNSLKISQDEVIAALKRLRAERRNDTDYKKIRQELPKDWPV